MDNFLQQLLLVLLLLQQNLLTTLKLLAILWGVQIINALIGYRLNYLGIYPRSVHGLLGIVLAPFLHGNFNHLFFNSIPLFMLASFILLGGWQLFVSVTVSITLLSGFAIWLLGRRAIHIGASHLIVGYWSYLLVNAYYHATIIGIVVAAVTLYYFAGILFSIMPTEKNESWEGHLFGFVAGIATVYWFPFNF